MKDHNPTPKMILAGVRAFFATARVRRESLGAMEQVKFSMLSEF